MENLTNFVMMKYKICFTPTKISVFWSMTTCSFVEGYLCFGEPAALILKIEDGDSTFHQNVGECLPKYILEDNNCCSRYCENLKSDMFYSSFKIVQVLWFIRIKN